MPPLRPPSLWYRQPWPWFIIALMTSAVGASLYMAGVAIRQADTLVSDRYYEAGKGINRILDRELLAEQLHLRAQLTLVSLDGPVRLNLTGASQPQRLVLNLLAPTQPEQDRQVTLLAVPGQPGQYTGQYFSPVTGQRRVIELLGEEGGQAWRLVDEEWLKPGVAVQLGDDALQGRLQ